MVNPDAMVVIYQVKLLSGAFNKKHGMCLADLYRSIPEILESLAAA